jgi:HSP20 family protein
LLRQLQKIEILFEGNFQRLPLGNNPVKEYEMPIVKIKIESKSGINSKRLSNITDEFFRTYPLVISGAGWTPDVDICETSDVLFIIADVAGIEPDQIKVVMEGGMLFLSGIRRPVLDKESKVFLQAEIEYGPFERSFRLSPVFDPEKIEARYENGLVIIKLEKKAPGKQTVKIHISG